MDPQPPLPQPTAVPPPQPAPAFNPVQPAAAPQPGKSFLMVFLLSMLLGVFGIDRFYLGRIWTGILKFLTFGGFGVWYLIDLIMILTNHTKAKDGSALQGYEQHKKIAFIALILWILVSGSSAAYDVLVVSRGVHDVSKLNGTTINCTSAGCSDTPKTPQSASNATVTPLGQTAVGTSDAAGFSVKLAAVIADPKTTGDLPDAGMHYVEVDFSITNSSSKSTFVPGSFYYQTSAGKLLNDAGVSGNGPGIDHKDVKLVDSSKEAMIAETVDLGKTDNTHYLIYQVPKGDVGKLVWFDGIFDTKSPKLGTFDLQ